MQGQESTFGDFQNISPQFIQKASHKMLQDFSRNPQMSSQDLWQVLSALGVKMKQDGVKQN